MKDFTALDNAILARIRESACTFTSINASVESLALPHATSSKRVQSFRVVDRRLQALRKRGLIYFGTTKWFITPDAHRDIGCADQ